MYKNTFKIGKNWCIFKTTKLLKKKDPDKEAGLCEK